MSDSPFVSSKTLSTLKGMVLEIKPLPINIALDYLAHDNPKNGDIGGIVQSIEKHGFADIGKWDSSLTNKLRTKGAFVFGNHRVQALHWMWSHADEIPDGVWYDDNGMWYVPVLVGLNSKNEALAQAFMIDHNLLTMSGGDYSDRDMWQMFNKDALLEVSESIQASELKEGESFSLVLSPASIEDLQRHVKYEKMKYEASLNPEIDTSDVTEGDIQTALKNAEGDSQLTSRDLSHVMCPHCGEEFYVNPS